MVITAISEDRRAFTRLVTALAILPVFLSCANMLGGNGRTVSITAGPAQVGVGGSAKYSITLSKVNSSASTTVNYSMSGTAIRGQDYTLSGTYGRAVVAKNARTAIVTLNGPSVGSGTGTKTATMTILAGSGYTPSSINKSTVLILTSPKPTPTPTPTPSPTPTPTPSATPAQTPAGMPTPVPQPGPRTAAWIAIRSDGHTGTGTQSDPFDGSTPEKFDAAMTNIEWSKTNADIHLVGSGPFRTNATHGWHLTTGFTLSGDGMYATTLQVMGNVAGIHSQIFVICSNSNFAINNVTIRDLTIDCNWQELSATADNGAGGEKNIKTGALMLSGSNNLIDHVRCINSYGSLANSKEHFAMVLTAPRNGEGTNNIIQYCRSESPKGNYGNPFALSGWDYTAPNYPIVHSAVLFSTAVGVNDGLANGFTSGGVNLAIVKNCYVHSNTFIDCFGAAYIDVGSIDGLFITNNTVTRGWQGVNLATHDPLKRNVQITGNNFLIQNRIIGGASYGVAMGWTETAAVTITNNTFNFDTGGRGAISFWGIQASLLNTASISDNVVSLQPTEYVANFATGLDITFSNNRSPQGHFYRAFIRTAAGRTAID